MAGERILDGLRKYRKRYKKLDKADWSRLLDEFCDQTGYHRKYATMLLGKPADSPSPGDTSRRRGPTYSPASVRVLAQIWKAVGYPWSARLKALLPDWLPWARAHIRGLMPEVECALLKMSARQMDRRLQGKKYVRGTHDVRCRCAAYPIPGHRARCLRAHHENGRPMEVVNRTKASLNSTRREMP